MHTFDADSEIVLGSITRVQELENALQALLDAIEMIPGLEERDGGEELLEIAESGWKVLESE